MKPFFIFVLLGFLMPISQHSAEKVGPQETHQRETSSLEDYSLKPVRLYSSRGRRDPFILQAKGVTVTARPELQEFTISKLEMMGYMGMEGEKIALFQIKDSKISYVLRAATLYGPGNQAVKEVRGRILANGDVELRQGERHIVFRKFRRTQ